jgi:hypothetical protein
VLVQAFRVQRTLGSLSFYLRREGQAAQTNGAADHGVARRPDAVGDLRSGMASGFESLKLPVFFGGPEGCGHFARRVRSQFF